MSRASIQLAITFGCMGFLALVWPTIYSYDHLQFGENRLPVRTHRISGSTEMLLPYKGWIAAAADSAVAEDSTKLATLPVEELAAVDGTLEIRDGQLTCKMYNGSKWRVQELVVEVRIVPFEIDWESLTAIDGDDDITVDAANKTRISDSPSPPRLVRDYKLSNNYFTEPLTTGIFDEYVWLNLMPRERLEWHIKSAKGLPQ